jgi:hypothetical protein
MTKTIRSAGILLALVGVFGLFSAGCAKRVASASGQYTPDQTIATGEGGTVSAGSGGLSEVEVTQTLQKVLQGLPENLVQFYPPPTMMLNDKVRVETRMARALLENLNRSLLAKEWKVDALVGARLSGDNFEFHGTAPEDQMVGSQEFTVWSWDVIPLAAGTQALKLNMTLRVITSTGAQYKALPVIERPVQIVEKRAGGFMKFLQAYWAWILGIVLVAGIVAILVIEPSNKRS